MIDFSKISAITIPEGNVLSIYQVTAGGDTLLWARESVPSSKIQVTYYDSPSAQITYHDGWDFSGCTMSISPTSYSYSGSGDTYPIASVEKPTVTVTDPKGVELTQGTDYTVSYQPTSGTIASGSTLTLSAIAASTWPIATGQLTKTYTATYAKYVPPTNYYTTVTARPVNVGNVSYVSPSPNYTRTVTLTPSDHWAVKNVTVEDDAGTASYGTSSVDVKGNATLTCDFGCTYTTVGVSISFKSISGVEYSSSPFNLSLTSGVTVVGPGNNYYIKNTRGKTIGQVYPYEVYIYPYNPGIPSSMQEYTTNPNMYCYLSYSHYRQTTSGSSSYFTYQIAGNFNKLEVGQSFTQDTVQPDGSSTKYGGTVTITITSLS